MLLLRNGLFLLLVVPLVAASADLRVERLTWAGVKISNDQATLLIDAVGRDLWNGNAPEKLVPVTSETKRTYALVTHMHNDHFDVDTLKDVLGERGYVFCHESDAAYVAGRGLKVIPLQYYVPVSRGGFYITAVPAVDGFGDTQVSFVVKHGDKVIFHAGDTLWHGKWQQYGDYFGPVDVAFLPVNGAKVDTGYPVSSPRVLTPAGAVDAAMMLKAKVLVPIHFGGSAPPGYVEVERPLEQLISAAKAHGQQVRHLAPGEVFQLTGI